MNIETSDLIRQSLLADAEKHPFPKELHDQLMELYTKVFASSEKQASHSAHRESSDAEEASKSI